MTNFQAVSPAGAYEMAMAFGHGCAELTNAQKTNRDWALAEALDKKADAHFAAGNDAMGKVCRARALAAADRAVRFTNAV